MSTASRDSWEPLFWDVAKGVTRGRDPICETNGGQMSLDRFGMLESVTTYVLCDASCFIQSDIVNWVSPKLGSDHPPPSRLHVTLGGGGARCEHGALRWAPAGKWCLPVWHGPILRGRPISVRDCTPRDPRDVLGLLGILVLLGVFARGRGRSSPYLLNTMGSDGCWGPPHCPSPVDATWPGGDPSPTWSQRYLWARLPCNHVVLQKARHPRALSCCSGAMH